MEQSEKQEIRAMVKTLYDYQEMRIRTANRLKKRADGSEQDQTGYDEPQMTEIPALVDVYQDTKEIENELSRAIEKKVKKTDLWIDFLKDVKGCGPMMAAVMISEFDIEKATTVSKLWQYSGLNPGKVRGKKASGSKKDGTFKIITTDSMVPGDRLTSGFLSPFNGFLRSKLIGVLAGGFLKANSPYRKYYDEYKDRKKHSENLAPTRKKGADEKAWKDESDGHRHNAALRYMMKMFLKDLYANWRRIEGLYVRQPYQEEYLGHEHTG